MNWIYFALLFSVFHACHSMLIKLAGENITPVFGMLVSNTVTFSGALILYFVFKAQGIEMVASKQAITYVALGGVAIIIFEVALFYMFFYGAPLSSSALITRTLPLIILIMMGVIFFGETPNTQKIFGMVLGLTGIYLMVKPS